ncbi:TPA: dolichol monophosphate mannose synthase [Escherichia coli]|nr:dolichol monophosphate mannose synthase [Escherichia coli]
MLYFVRERESAFQTAEVAAYFGMSIYQARYYLISLESRGGIIRSPRRRGAKTLWTKSRGEFATRKEVCNKTLMIL